MNLLKRIPSATYITLVLIAMVFGTYLYNMTVPSLMNENIYLRGVFPVIRKAYDSTLGYLPFPFVYLLFMILLSLIIGGFYDFFLSIKRRKYWGFVRRMINVSCIIYVMFYWSWAMNYKNRSLSKQLNLIPVSIDSTMVYEEAMAIMRLLKPLRDSISLDTMALSDTLFNKEIENELRTSMVRLFRRWYLPYEGRVRVRELHPKGILLHIATSGVYIPFAFEGHVDAGVPRIQFPFTMAHEMSHGYGITDEGECNFIGILVCANTDDLYIQYSGLLAYWRYLANSLIRTAPTLALKALNERSPSINNDIILIRTTLNQYKDYIPNMRDLIYDSYLKSHGVKAGIGSYSQVVTLMQEWKKSFHNRELYERLYIKKQ